jgi:hypothetical protein
MVEFRHMACCHEGQARGMLEHCCRYGRLKMQTVSEEHMRTDTAGNLTGSNNKLGGDAYLSPEHPGQVSLANRMHCHPGEAIYRRHRAWQSGEDGHLETQVHEAGVRLCRYLLDSAG